MRKQLLLLNQSLAPYILIGTMMLRSIFVRHFSNIVAKCVIIHPVSFPNKGPILEQYLAQQALGLAKSLGWTIVRGPFWNGPEAKTVLRDRRKESTHLFIEGDTKQLQDGDYVKTSLGSGILHRDGIIFDEMEEDSEGDLYRQWQDKILRQSLANSSLVKVRHTTKKTYFTKGKLHYIADFLKKTDFDCLFINAELKPTQLKNLKKFMQARINDVSVASAYPQREQFQSDSEFQTEDNSPILMRRNQSAYRKISVFDRFSIILQIFSLRTTSKLAKLQVELSYLTYIRTRLVREGATYLATLGNFSGDLLNNAEAAMEVISAKQRRAARTLGGEGESQLELERRKLRDRQAQIRKQIEDETRLRRILQDKRQRRAKNPVVALVGYTNVGKSALMNWLMKKREVESKDLLFQTLHTTNRSILLPSGTKITLLDTIGFISDLPVEMIEAFKSTLEQISHADLVIHLRDCSHPHNDLQKKSVLKILDQMGFGKAFQEQKMLQVWNKVDLVATRPDSSIAISCLNGIGVSELVSAIEERLKKIKGQSKRVIEYDLSVHGEVLQWLKENTNHSFNVETEYNYQPTKLFPSGSAKISIDLDEAALGRLQKFLNPNKDKKKSQKGMPPKEGW